MHDTDRLAFLNSTGAYASLPTGVTTTGVDDIDLWIGGLAEETLPFGGFLGSTFNFVFENQLETCRTVTGSTTWPALRVSTSSTSWRTTRSPN